MRQNQETHHNNTHHQEGPHKDQLPSQIIETRQIAEKGHQALNTFDQKNKTSQQQSQELQLLKDRLNAITSVATDSPDQDQALSKLPAKEQSNIKQVKEKALTQARKEFQPQLDELNSRTPQTEEEKAKLEKEKTALEQKIQARAHELITTDLNQLTNLIETASKQVEKASEQVQHKLKAEQSSWWTGLKNGINAIGNKLMWAAYPALAITTMIAKYSPANPLLTLFIAGGTAVGLYKIYQWGASTLNPKDVKDIAEKHPPKNPTTETPPWWNEPNIDPNLTNKTPKTIKT